MMMAVQWVRNHIGFFGGNPYQIVVMGHGTGASSALLVALTNVAKGYTNGVIALSGTAVSHWAVDNEPITTAREVADYQGCPTASALSMIKCLQQVPGTSVIQGDSYIANNRLQSRGFTSGLQGRLGSIPVTELQYDGRSLPPMVEGEPLDKMHHKEIPKIPLLTGVTKDETKNAINGQYQNDIKRQLRSIPHFLDNVLVKDLQSLTGLGRKGQNNESASGLWTLLEPLKFIKYTAVESVTEGLNKISEITADALFNLPAFLTANLWSKTGAPVFLYRFEHSGKSKTARHFLKGLPIIGDYNISDTNNNTVGHGDDLIYLFEARSLNGTAIPDVEEDFTENDRKVRDIFTEMISTFARHGRIDIDKKEIPSFSDKSNNYVQISARPKLLNNFRFCEMALWAGLTERLQSAACSLLQVLDTQLTNVGSVLLGTVDSAGSQIIPGKPSLVGSAQQIGGNLGGILNINMGGNKSNRGILGIL
ncbi:hypothetical protein ILUMI_20800 [Ignelater luminosus]|uniref:Carboxylesterase type B domain-containing protein n=1 Tax=Ignelater luminosus TaxID=2038154 RepID=A0A8K0G211_IGNLU|nr:hypothetical protein ILUMI_20800 [Ignelater luminosus]